MTESSANALSQSTLAELSRRTKVDFKQINDVNRPQASDRCAWYLRVSTPKQKLEHQREHVARYCEQDRIVVPETMKFEDKEKRHKSAKRQDFQRLLDCVRAGQLDW